MNDIINSTWNEYVRDLGNGKCIVGDSECNGNCVNGNCVIDDGNSIVNDKDICVNNWTFNNITTGNLKVTTITANMSTKKVTFDKLKFATKSFYDERNKIIICCSDNGQLPKIITINSKMLENNHACKRIKMIRSNHMKIVRVPGFYRNKEINPNKRKNTNKGRKPITKTKKRKNEGNGNNMRNQVSFTVSGTKLDFSEKHNDKCKCRICEVNAIINRELVVDHGVKCKCKCNVIRGIKCECKCIVAHGIKCECKCKQVKITSEIKDECVRSKFKYYYAEKTKYATVKSYFDVKVFEKKIQVPGASRADLKNAIEAVLCVRDYLVSFGMFTKDDFELSGLSKQLQNFKLKIELAKELNLQDLLVTLMMIDGCIPIQIVSNKLTVKFHYNKKRTTIVYYGSGKVNVISKHNTHDVMKIITWFLTAINYQLNIVKPKLIDEIASEMIN